MPDKKQDDTEEELPEFVIEGARSGRSRCKTCRRKIAMGGLRIGVLIEGPFGTGYLWHHLNCLAKNRIDLVESAYELEAWNFAKEKPKGLPKITTLRGLGDKAEKQKKERQEMPYAELAPSGRSKCKQCGDAIKEGAARIILGREVTFGQQVRSTPVKVHPACIAAELERDDTTVTSDELEIGLRANSKTMTPEAIESLILILNS